MSKTRDLKVSFQNRLLYFILKNQLYLICNLTHVNVNGKVVINFIGTQERHISGEAFERTLISEHFHTSILWKQTGIFWSYMPPVCIHIEIQADWSLSMLSIVSAYLICLSS